MYQLISWYQTTDDFRPLNYPPNEQILGWWCTGERQDDGAHTLVAHVRADTEEAAKIAILRDWPEAAEWRFCDEADGSPPGDGFPLDDWMVERYEPTAQEGRD